MFYSLLPPSYKHSFGKMDTPNFFHRFKDNTLAMSNCCSLTVHIKGIFLTVDCNWQGTKKEGAAINEKQ